MIASTRVLIKYHKIMKEKGKFPTRLLIPDMNFTATFSKLGYLGIKKTLVKEKVNYAKITIVQASDTNKKLEEIRINIDEWTIISIDDINMYPPINLAKTKKEFKIILKGNHLFGQETNLTLLGPNMIHNLIHLYLFQRALLRIPRSGKEIIRVRSWWIKIGFLS